MVYVNEGVACCAVAAPACCLMPDVRLVSAQALMSQLESQASAVATASTAAATRRQQLEQQQEELKKNLKVGCPLPGSFTQ